MVVLPFPVRQCFERLRYRQTPSGSQPRTGLRRLRTFFPQVFRVARASCGRMPPAWRVAPMKGGTRMKKLVIFAMMAGGMLFAAACGNKEEAKPTEKTAEA